jgi:hypothetical protein
MYIQSSSCRPKPSIEHQLHRLGGIMDVIIHLFPESVDLFDYDEELLTLILVARDLTHDICDQVQSNSLESFAGSASQTSFLQRHQPSVPHTDLPDGRVGGPAD